MHHIEVITQLEGTHAEQLDELIRAAITADDHHPIGEHKFLRLQKGDDLAVGFVAKEGDDLAGYAHTLTFGSGAARRVSSELVVHPNHRREGVGRALLQCIVAHADAEGSSTLDLWAYNDSPASRALAREFSLQPTRRLLHMHRHPGPPPILPQPTGASIRAFDPGVDGETWLGLNNRIFEGHPENGTWTLDDLSVRMEQPWFNANDVLILEADGHPAGFCWVKVEDRGDEGRVGEIYIIGTLPEYHGRGLGRYLLSEGLRHLADQNVDAVAVYVDQSNERAVALYWSFEFHHHHVDVLYSMPLGTSQTETEALTATS